MILLSNLIELIYYLILKKLWQLNILKQNLEHQLVLKKDFATNIVSHCKKRLRSVLQTHTSTIFHFRSKLSAIFPSEVARSLTLISSVSAAQLLIIVSESVY